MKNSLYTVQIIEPSEGMWLKQKNTEIQNMFFSKKVFLAINDTPYNWEEVTEEYKTEIEKKQKELQEKENKEVNQQ